MGDLSPAITSAVLNTLISVRPVASSHVADSTQQAAGNTLRAQVGQLIQGTIFGMNSDGEPLLKSEQGNLALKLPFHLPSGIDVVLRMEAASNGLRARVLLVDGLPLKDYAAQILGGRPTGGGAPQDIVSVHANLAQAMSKPTTPQSQQQLLNLQSAALPGESNPALNTQNQRLQAGMAAPLVSSADPQLTRLLQVVSDPVTVLLLSRNPQLAAALQQMPTDIPLPARLMPGMQIQMQLVAVEKPNLPEAPPLPSTAQPAASSPAASTLPLPTAMMPVKADMATAMDLNQMLGKLAAQQQARGAAETTTALLAATTDAPKATPPQPQVPLPTTGQAQVPLPNAQPALMATAQPTVQNAPVTIQTMVPAADAPPVAANAVPSATVAVADKSALTPTQTTPAQAPLPSATASNTASISTNPAAPLPAQSGATPAPLNAPAPQTPVFTTAPMGIPANAQGVFGGQVIDVDGAGEALIQTVFGVVRMPPQQGIALQEGDRVQWQLQGFLPPTQNVARPTDALSQLLGLATRWDSLEDTLDWLSATQQLAGPGSIGPQALVSHLPKPDGKMGAAILFLIAAMRRNESHSWIGKNTVSMLQEKGRGDLLGRLDADFSIMRQPLVDSPSPNWQALFFPIWADDQLHQARFFIHRNPEDEKDGGSKDKGGNDIRFVLELTLSALGDMQLCGLVRKTPPPVPEVPGLVHFDLVVRSLRTLSGGHQQEIRDIFRQGAEITGYQGQILFQQSALFPETPMESFASAMPGWTA